MITYSYAKGGQDMGVANTPEKYAPTLKGIFEFLEQGCRLTPQATLKKNCHMFIPGVFEDSVRDEEHFIKTRLLAIDIDTIQNEGDFLKDLESLEDKSIGFILHGTPSHSLDNPRYRLLLELDEDCLDSYKYSRCYEETVSSILPQAQFSKNITAGYSVDIAIKNCSGFLFIPQEDKLDTFLFSAGEPIQIKGNHKKTHRPNTSKKDANLVGLDMQKLKGKDVMEKDLEDVLQYLEKNELSITDDYEDWLNVGFACASLKYSDFTETESLDMFKRFSYLSKSHDLDDHELEAKFHNCSETSHNRISISTVFFLAQKAGWIKTNDTFQGDKIGMVEAKGGNKVHLVYKSDREGETLLQMTQEIYLPTIAQAHIINAQDPIYTLEPKHVKKEPDEEGKQKNLSVPNLLSLNRVPQPEGIEFLLGAEKKGTYYNTLTNTISYAKHCIAPATPKFSQEIHDWLSQLPVDINWLYTYLVKFTDLGVAVPCLHFHGESNSGKSLFILLVSTLHEGGDVSNSLDGKGFDAFAGTTPLKIFEERPPSDIAELKRLVTMHRHQVDQKFDGRMLTVIGYFRVITAVNQPDFTLSVDSDTDTSALFRRIQPICMTEENSTYLAKIGGIEKTKSWVNGAFKNHMAWIRENLTFFTMIQSAGDIVTPQPKGIEDEEKAKMGISQFDRDILECVCESLHTKVCNSLIKKPKNIHLFVDEFIEELRRKGHTRRTLTVNKLRKILEPVFGKLKRDKNKNNVGELRLNFDKVVTLSESFNLVIEDNRE